MKNVRAVALLLALCLLLIPAAGCRQGEDTARIATYRGGEIPAGAYLYYLTSVYDEAALQVEDPSGDVLSQTVEGVPAADWIAARAKEETEALVGTAVRFEELGLSLDADQLTEIQSSVSSIWSNYGDQLERYGISKSSIERVVTASYQSSVLMKKLYGEGGEQEVPEEMLLAHYEEVYRRVVFLVISRSMLEGEFLEQEQSRLAEYETRARGGEALEDLMLEEYVFQTGLTLEEVQEKYGGSARESIVSKDSTGYPAGLIDQVFAAPKNTVQKYGNDEYDVLFEVRELTGDDFSLDAVRDAVLQDYCRDDYAAYLKEAAYASGLAFNEKALARYTIQEVVQR